MQFLILLPQSHIGCSEMLGVIENGPERRAFFLQNTPYLAKCAESFPFVRRVHHSKQASKYLLIAALCRHGCRFSARLGHSRRLPSILAASRPLGTFRFRMATADVPIRRSQSAPLVAGPWQGIVALELGPRPAVDLAVLIAAMLLR